MGERRETFRIEMFLVVQQEPNAGRRDWAKSLLLAPTRESE